MDTVAIPKNVMVQLEVISDLFGSLDMTSPYFQGQDPLYKTSGKSFYSCDARVALL